MPGLIVNKDDVCFYVTEKCNSNCVMCPMSEDSRKRGNQMCITDWELFEEQIEDYPSHITITGGEPFLCHERLIPLLSKINLLYPDSEILILTNGRALAIPEIMNNVSPLITEHYCFAIPIHGPNALLHDTITASPGSFQQSIAALYNLSKTDAKIEIRIVGHQLNLECITDIYKMLCSLKARINVINLIAMEMTGCAAKNRDHLWVDYNELSAKAEEGIRHSIVQGIDNGLYNFPLCQVSKQLWPLVKHSITPSKIMYPEACCKCSCRDACGGMFYSTCLLNLCSVKPFVEDE